MGDQVGAIIECGPSDWQILQQDTNGAAAMQLSGRWVSGEPGKVQVRVAMQDSNVSVSRSLDWQNAQTNSDGTWSLALRIPAGGLYRIETRYKADTNLASEWSMRGDMRHFIGVGDLWIIAGQSNSAGYGRGPIADPPELGLHLFSNDMRWKLATHPMNESTDTKHPVNSEVGNPGHSPYLHFARLLKQHLGYPIGLIQTSLGGSPLSRWNPVELGDKADLYENMLTCVKSTCGAARGVLWYQGESDTGGENAISYGKRFIATVAAWRKALNDPKLAVVTVQLNRVYQQANSDSDVGWSRVREHQRKIPCQLENCVVVPAIDLPLSDWIHISPSGNMLLADRMARSALGAFYGRSMDYLPPDAKSAKRLEGGKAIDLVFDHVTSRMGTIDPTAIPFQVEDISGLAAVTAIEYPGHDTVRLKLQRPIQGKALVHGNYGICPPTTLMDVERLLPMLGFYGLEVL